MKLNTRLISLSIYNIFSVGESGLSGTKRANLELLSILFSTASRSPVLGSNLGPGPLHSVVCRAADRTVICTV